MVLRGAKGIGFAIPIEAASRRRPQRGRFSAQDVH
jgi:hypothetical protein